MANDPAQTTLNEERLVNADAVYLDTSVLVAQCFNEPNRVRLVNALTFRCSHFAPGRLGTSVVAIGELIGRLNKRTPQQGNQVHPVSIMRAVRSYHRDLDHGYMTRVEPPDELGQIIIQGEELSKLDPKIGAFDLWHVMAAREWRRTKQGQHIFLSFDTDQLKVAAKVGLNAVNGDDLSADEVISVLKRLGQWPVK